MASLVNSIITLRKKTFPLSPSINITNMKSEVSILHISAPIFITSQGS